MSALLGEMSVLSPQLRTKVMREFGEQRYVVVA
jgi:hypothetical protein